MNLFFDFSDVKKIVIYLIFVFLGYIEIVNVGIYLNYLYL